MWFTQDASRISVNVPEEYREKHCSVYFPSGEPAGSGSVFRQGCYQSPFRGWWLWGRMFESGRLQFRIKV